MFLRVYYILALCFLSQVLARKQKVISLTSQNWRDVLEGEWMIKFYAPWCPACRSMADDYKKFADWSDDLNMKVAEVDINEETGLSGRFIVTALPTIYHAKDGQFRRYVGQRDSNSLHVYIEEELWRGTDAVAWYRHPDSIPMMLMSYLFQTSMVIKVFHETLTEEYGFTTTTAYVIFGLVTVVTGLFLGLVLVVVIECVAPQRPRGGNKKIIESTESSENLDESEEEEGVDSAQSSPGSARDKKDASSASEDEEPGSQPSKLVGSQSPQKWEKTIRAEEDDSEDNVNCSDEQEAKEKGQGELRRRKVDKSEVMK